MKGKLYFLIIVLSFMLVANPFFSGISLVMLTALAFIFAGAASIILAFDLKKIKDYPNKLGNNLKMKIKMLQEEIQNVVKE